MSTHALPQVCCETIAAFRAGCPLNRKDRKEKKVDTRWLRTAVKTIEKNFATNRHRFLYRSVIKKLERREIAFRLINSQVMLSMMCWCQCVDISSTPMRRCAQLLSLNGLLVSHQGYKWWKDIITLGKARTVFWSTVSLSALVNIATCLRAIYTFQRTPNGNYADLFLPLLTSQMTVYHQSFGGLCILVLYRTLNRFVREKIDILSHRL